MSVGGKEHPVSFDRHTPEYIHQFVEIKDELQGRCPLAFSDTYGGHWVASGYETVFELARNATLLSNDKDYKHERKGYRGVSIPPLGTPNRAGFLEMDPPEQRDYRRVLNPYLSPAAVVRWRPMAEDLTRACLDECIESGQIDFVDDLANIVPAVMTMALLGFRLADYEVYLETTHAIIYTPNDSPDKQRVLENYVHMMAHAAASITEVRRNPRPGLVNALVETPVLGRRLDDDEIVAVLQLLIAGGFDTTTALTAHSLEWLSQNQSERERLRSCEPGLLDSATEEFLRFYAPAPGDARTVTHDYVCAGQQLAEGDRLWLSWAMANRDPNVFPDPDTIKLDRKHNRHTAFGLGVHRCIGSNVARALFKVMATAVLERMPDFVCDAAGTVHYDTIGVINGMKHLPATFTPRPRRGVGLVDTIAHWQEVVDEQRLAAPIDASDVND